MFLSDRDIRALQDASWQLSACRSAQELEYAANEWLRARFGADYCALNDFSPDPANLLRVVADPPDSIFPLFRQALIDRMADASALDHPAFQHYFFRWSELVPVRLSDLVSDRQLRSTAAYQYVLSLVSANHQLLLMVRRQAINDGAGYALTRKAHDFSEHDRDLATALQPVLYALNRALPIRSGVDGADAEAGVRLRSSLTPAEFDVLRLVADGLTAVAIGHIRRTSPRTVRKHLESIYAKLGYHDRLQAVTYARASGLLPRV